VENHRPILGAGKKRSLSSKADIREGSLLQAHWIRMATDSNRYRLQIGFFEFLPTFIRLGINQISSSSRGISATARNTLQEAHFSHLSPTRISSLGWFWGLKIIAVDSFGAIGQFPGGLKAKCPVQHMSEFEVAKPGKKFEVNVLAAYAF
jgi:hypothetical protein